MANSIWGTPNGLSGNGATLTFPLGTQITENALGQLAMVSASASNELRIPNGSNAEFASLGWSTNVAQVGIVPNGGTNRNARILGGNSAVIFQAGGSDQWQFNSSGHLVALTDNALDIGQSGANRPRNVFAGTRETAPAYTAGASNGVSFGPAGVVSITVVNGIVTAAS